MLRGANIDPYLHLKWLFKNTFKPFLPQVEQSVILLTRERCYTVNISSRHRKYSINGDKPSNPAGTSFGILTGAVSRDSKVVKQDTSISHI